LYQRQARADLLLHAGAVSRILQTLEHRLVAAIVSPRRDDGAQIVLAGGVRVDVCADVEPFRAGLVDHRRDLFHLAPELLIRHLQVNDVDPDLGSTADFNRFGH
jgi:hypothetical protein